MYCNHEFIHSCDHEGFTIHGYAGFPGNNMRGFASEGQIYVELDKLL
jgi:hypothetical protein